MKKVILMDDEPLIQRVTGQMINALGYEVEIAGDGAAAVSKYKELLDAGTEIHAILMDLTIPGGMGATEALAQIKEIDPEVKAVVSTGHAYDDVVLEYEKHGFVATLVKPYQLSALKDLLEGLG